MLTHQKAAGIAALVQAAAYIAGFAAIATFLNPGDVSSWSSLQKLEFVLGKKDAFQALHVFIYVVFGVALVVLVTAIHEQLKHHSPALSQIAAAFGLIWSGLVVASGMVANTGLEAVAAIHGRSPEEAAATWGAIGAVQDGLGGGIEVVGGIWMLVISLAAMRASWAGKFLSVLGILVGAAGILTVIPWLKELGALFGLGQIVWFLWVGAVLLSHPAADKSSKPSPLRGKA
jgi:hypothetical protein